MKNFKPTKKKLIISAVLTVAWVLAWVSFLAPFYGSTCIGPPEYRVSGTQGITVSVGCNVILQYVVLIILPYIVIYVAYSLLEGIFSKPVKASKNA